MDGLRDMISKHPWLVFLAIGVVALIAYIQSRDNVATFAGDWEGVPAGGGPHPLDPNVAATQQAAIAAGHENIGTLASLILGVDTNDAQLENALTRTAAERDVSLRTIDASEQAALAQYASQEHVALSQIDANKEIESGRTIALLDATKYTSDQASEVARINADLSRYIADVEGRNTASSIASNERVALASGQYGKDIARAQANTSIVNNIVGAGRDLLHLLTLGFI